MTEDPLAVAKNFLSLVRAGKTADSVRALIGNSTPSRQKISAAFDHLVRDAGAKQQPRRGPTVKESKPVQKVKTKSGQSAARQRTTVPRSPKRANKTGRRFFLRGRGRKFSPQLTEQITERIKAGSACSGIR